MIAAVGLALALAARAVRPATGTGEGVDYEVAENAADNFDDGTRMKELAESGKITIGVKYDQPGIGFKGATDDTPVGFDLEMGKILAASLGIAPEDITWKETISDNREPFLQNGEVDLVIASYSITDERRAGRRPGRPVLRHRPAAPGARRTATSTASTTSRAGGLLGHRLDVAREHGGRGRHPARLRHLLRVRGPGSSTAPSTR